MTIKVEHLVRHAKPLPCLVQTGCLFVTSAAESVDDTVLGILNKGHTRAEFEASVAACREAGLTMNPTFVAFHPWLTRAGLLETFAVLDNLDLVGSLAPIQLTTRLLVPEGSLLLDLPEHAHLWQELDRARLVHPWAHLDRGVGRPAAPIRVPRSPTPCREGADRWATFDRLWVLAGGNAPTRLTRPEQIVPQFLEPWFCCSEPVGELVTGWNIPEPQEVTAASD